MNHEKHEGRKARRAELNPSRPFILRRSRTTAADGRDPPRRAVWRTAQLPVSALPQVDYPTIQALTFYPGASPDVMASSVTAPLERQFGQIARSQPDDIDELPAAAR